MPIDFTDNRNPFARPDLADLDRVYPFAWDQFTEADWHRLDAVYKRMPGWLGYDPAPWWFGKDARKSPHLTASVELPGLQVTGVVPSATFTSWHDAFMAAIQDFPAAE